MSDRVYVNQSGDPIWSVQELTAEIRRLRQQNTELRQLIEDSKPRIRKLQEQRNAAIELLRDWQHFVRGVDSLFGPAEPDGAA